MSASPLPSRHSVGIQKGFSEPSIVPKSILKNPSSNQLHHSFHSTNITAQEQPQQTQGQLDNWHDLLNRKREMEKNKLKLHLTEADCNLLLTNANEFNFTKGQIIAKEGQTLTSVYRIKFGSVSLVNPGGKKVCDLTQGWFLGETMLVNGKGHAIDGSLVANGDVTLAELNLSFVRRLFDVDHVLALKFYRHLAAKLSSVFYALVGNLLGSCLVDSISMLSIKNLQPVPSSSTDSPVKMGPQIKALSSITSYAPILQQCPNVPDSFFLEVVNRRRKSVSRRKSISTSLHLAYKEYPLAGSGKSLQTAKLKKNKIKLVSESFGFKHKNAIEYTKIKNVVRTSEQSVTIIYDKAQAKTLFFKSVDEAGEFYGLVLSLVDSTSAPQHSPKNDGAPISSPPAIEAPEEQEESTAPEDEELKLMMRSMSTNKELVKGDLLFEEGDLYQRVYHIISGEIAVISSGRMLKTIGPGEVIGVPSILHLRPSPCTMQVYSETASVSVIPAYKINDLVNSNTHIAAKIFRRASETIHKQIENVLRKLAEAQKQLPLSPPITASASTSSSSLASSSSHSSLSLSSSELSADLSSGVPSSSSTPQS